MVAFNAIYLQKDSVDIPLNLISGEIFIFYQGSEKTELMLHHAISGNCVSDNILPGIL